MDQYDIVIIGSGLGGLICANVLSKEGLKVCVLEKNTCFGGCLQSYKRRGGIIDTGIHYVGCLDDGQILNQYFKYLGIIDKLKLKRLDADGFDIINIMGKEYKHVMGHENFIETLSRSFPQEHKNIRTIINKFKSIGDLISVNTLREEKAFSAHGSLPYFNTSAIRFLKENTSNTVLQDVISGTSTLTGEELTASLYAFSMITNSNIESSYRFIDGSQQVADLLIENIRANGGDVISNMEVTHINVKDDLIESVEINHSEKISGKHFISDVHPSKTLELLDKTHLIKKAYISRINSLKESSGFFTVSLVFKENTFEYLNKNYYYYGSGQIWTSKDYINDPSTKALFCTAAPASGKYAKVAHILEPMYWEEVERWKDTTVGKRGGEYGEFKQRRAEALINFLEQFQPGIKDKIETYYTSTPLTYRDYTGTKNGSAYGIVKDYNNAIVSLLPSKTRIPNLYFTGQNNNVHGMIGVILTAMNTCSAFLEEEYLAKKIGNA